MEYSATQKIEFNPRTARTEDIQYIYSNDAGTSRLDLPLALPFHACPHCGGCLVIEKSPFSIHIECFSTAHTVASWHSGSRGWQLFESPHLRPKGTLFEEPEVSLDLELTTDGKLLPRLPEVRLPDYMDTVIEQLYEDQARVEANIVEVTDEDVAAIFGPVNLGEEC